MHSASGPTTYQLYILVARRVVVTVGKLGPCDFPAGEYIYTGSAKKTIESRIARHLTRVKTLRWHIDYLLAAPEVEIIGVARWAEAECTVNQRSLGATIVPRFGTTDCRNGCGSHLKFIGATDDRPQPAAWRSISPLDGARNGVVK